MTTFSQLLNDFALQRSLSLKQHDVAPEGNPYPWVYLRWLEGLRQALILDYWSPDLHPSSTIGTVLTSTHIEYKQALQHSPSSTNWWGSLWIAELGHTRWTLNSEIYCDRTLIVTAIQTGMHLNWVTKQPIPIPEELAAAYWEAQWNS